MIDGTNITDATTVPIAWMWGFGLAAGGWALWLQRKLSRIDSRLERIEEAHSDYVSRADMVSWILAAVRENEGKSIKFPNLPKRGSADEDG